MNSKVAFVSHRSSSAVVRFRSPNTAHTMSRRKMGYAVLPARIMRPMVMRTK